MQSNKKSEKEAESAGDKMNNEELIEDSIEQLNSLVGSKPSAQWTEKDEKILHYRNKILNMEENKIAKKLELVSKNKEKYQKIRVNINKDRKIMENKKKNDLINLEKQKSKNSNLKIRLDKSLKNWKTSVSKRNKEEADKIKEERNKIRT